MEAGSMWKMWGNFSWRSVKLWKLWTSLRWHWGQWGTGGFSRLMVNKESPWASAKKMGNHPLEPPECHQIAIGWFRWSPHPGSKCLCCSISLRRISWVIVIIRIFRKLGRGGITQNHVHIKMVMTFLIFSAVRFQDRDQDTAKKPVCWEISILWTWYFDVHCVGSSTDSPRSRTLWFELVWTEEKWFIFEKQTVCARKFQWKRWDFSRP